MLLGVILTAQLMVVLDATIVNVALPHMQQSLGFSSSALSWVLNAYVLTFGGLLLLGARCGDLLGRKRTFLTGIGLFSLSSLAGGFATAGWVLLAAGAVQGIGAALVAPAALALLATIFPEGRQRVRAVALYTTVSAVGAAAGLVAGGLLTEWTSWRWVMFVNVPIGVAVVAVGLAALGRDGRRGSGPRRGRHRRLDRPSHDRPASRWCGPAIGLVSWTPEGFVGQMFATMKPYSPPPPPGAQPPPLWGDEDYVRGLLGDRVTDAAASRRMVTVDRFETPDAFRNYFKANYGPTVAAYRALADEPRRVAELDRDLSDLPRRHDRGTAPTIMDWEYLLLTARRVA